MVSLNAYTDGQLLESLKQGSESAFKALYERYWQRLIDAAYKRLQDQEQAEDIVQNIFLSLWLRRLELDITNLPVYLFTSVRNRVYGHIARHKAQELFYEPFAAVLSGTDTADGMLVAKELFELIIAYSQTLPPKRRQIFLMYIKDRLSTAEIAESLELSPSTVKNQLATALKDMRDDLAPFVLALIFMRL